MSLECAAQEFLRIMYLIWSCPLSDHAQPGNSLEPICIISVMPPNVDTTMVGDREARIIIVKNGGKHPSGSTATTIPYTPREKGGGALHSMEEVYKVTKTKAVIMLYRNGYRAMAMVCEFEERAEELSHSLLAKEAAKYAEEMGLQLQVE